MRANRNLNSFVQVERFNGWDTIAGFDVESVAIDYGKNCAEGKPDGWCNYRVVKGGKVVWSNVPAG